MIITTSDVLPGMTVTAVRGMVQGNTIRARNVGRDIMAGLRNIVGGEITEYTRLMTESRAEATQRMVEEAEALGANAIIGVRYTTSMEWLEHQSFWRMAPQSSCRSLNRQESPLTLRRLESAGSDGLRPRRQSTS